MSRAASAVLGITAAALIGSILLQLAEPVAPDGRSLLPAAPVRVDTDPAGGAGVPTAGDAVAVALARPLFNASRRPAVPASAPVPAAVNRGVPRLTGVIVGPAGRLAIFAGPEGGRPLVVGEGDAVDGYMVRSIEAGEVTLDGPNGVVGLRPSAIVPTAPPQPTLPIPDPLHPAESPEEDFLNQPDGHRP